MMPRRLIMVGAMIWAGAGLGVALGGLGSADPGARVLVGFASVIFPLAAALACLALAHHHDRLAGLLLLVSVATPTYFAWAINVPALVVGFAVLVAPRAALRPSQPPGFG